MLHQHKIMTVFSIAMETLKPDRTRRRLACHTLTQRSTCDGNTLRGFLFCVLLGAYTSPGCARFGGPPSGGLPKRAQPGEVWALDPPYLLFLWDPFGGIPGVEHAHVTPQLFKTDASSSDP